jgi:hypothetical protein
LPRRFRPAKAVVRVGSSKAALLNGLGGTPGVKGDAIE